MHAVCHSWPACCYKSGVMYVGGVLGLIVTILIIVVLLRVLGLI